MRLHIVCICFALTASPVMAGEDQDAVWTVLFDGGDLNAWKMSPTAQWKVEDGVIVLRREMDGKEHNADYLWTRQQYGDFVLELEFKTEERANSGVFLRTSDVSDPVYTGIEVQVANSYGKETWTRGNCVGAIYDLMAPEFNAAKKPGEWQRLRVVCRGPQIAVAVNGKSLLRMDLDQWTTPNKNPDGSPNKFPRALKDFARVGYVGLQDHGRPVWYRNIRIQRLP